MPACKYYPLPLIIVINVHVLPASVKHANVTLSVQPEME